MEPGERDGDEEEEEAAAGGGKGRGGRYGRGGIMGWTGGGAEEEGEGVDSVTGGGEEGVSPGTAAPGSSPSPSGSSLFPDPGVASPLSPTLPSADGGGLLLSPSSIELRLITPGAGAIIPSAIDSTYNITG